MVIIHLAAVVREPVAHNEVVYLEQQIVDRNLVEHVLRHLQGGGLVLYNHPGVRRGVVHHGVASQPLLSHREHHLVGHDCRGVAQRFAQEVHEVLADVLLGCECHVLSAEYVEYRHPARLSAEPCLKGWQVELLSCHSQWGMSRQRSPAECRQNCRI